MNTYINVEYHKDAANTLIDTKDVDGNFSGELTIAKN